MRFLIGVLGIFILIISGIVIGWSLHEALIIPEEESIQREYDGLWTRNYTEREYFYKGDWVHVNINGMSFERALEVCKHETGHEIFAEVCERNMTKCLEVTK